MDNTPKKYFVEQGSIVREIWSKADNILFVFAGSAAEFALNKAVDWLYFTGNLPADPLGRLFSTVAYGRMIIFSEYDGALAAIDKINAIHHGVEKARGAQIPDWAYRDVIYMLIDYSIRSFELLERPLSDEEKEDVFDVFYRMGLRMGLKDMPYNYKEWLISRVDHLREHLVQSHYTLDLFKQYKKHLGTVRYQLLKQVQLLIVPDEAKRLLPIDRLSYLSPVISFYKLTRLVGLHGLLKEAILPPAYKSQIREMDVW
ncbi:oxygenase MpaB family protein [Mucilaginibacter pedocola]|uniref:ER-bound oxygenase mpaB/mpaB'/Rubber oxygenase catalytic domain-containing protein n=1 Tax=Mucilaginibacter pedocola TaxID=1792845 RepID=A0A1S9PAJ5_9SPHI|nr:oxygenase MpaB family protein [Mucilaginibacter pedocola]OOQ58004.1 hypothetical protein BC343_10085 [Mucilaginibacter pedocola]